MLVCFCFIFGSVFLDFFFFLFIFLLFLIFLLFFPCFFCYFLYFFYCLPFFIFFCSFPLSFIILMFCLLSFILFLSFSLHLPSLFSSPSFFSLFFLPHNSKNSFPDLQNYSSIFVYFVMLSVLQSAITINPTQ